jgi:hypothetical protein
MCARWFRSPPDDNLARSGTARCRNFGIVAVRKLLSSPFAKSFVQARKIKDNKIIREIGIVRQI